jgi:hypothetical protein
MRRIFWDFCRNWFGIGPLHYNSSRSDFGFEFAEIFVIEKRLANSLTWGIADSPSRRVAMVSRGVAIQTFLNLSSNFRTLNR